MKISCACGETGNVLVVAVNREGVAALCEACYEVSDKSTTLRLNLSDPELESRARSLWGEVVDERY